MNSNGKDEDQPEYFTFDGTERGEAGRGACLAGRQVGADGGGAGERLEDTVGKRDVG